jgi:DNA-binding transcriptional MerR regulator
VKKEGGGWHQASEFAALTGVTVRALHHYDRLGLLKPTGRTQSGYRLYGERDFARLQQIVTLKFIGFPLKQIRDILDRDELDLAAMLRLQGRIIREKRRLLDNAIEVIEKAERVFAANGEPDWEMFQKIIEVINMQNDGKWMDKYYSEEARQEIAERAKNWTPEMQAKVEQDWAALFKEVQAAVDRGEDPSSETAQTLAARWSALISGFTGGNPAVQEGLNKLYSDQGNWPSTFQKPYSDEAAAFICKAIAIGKGEASQ